MSSAKCERSQNMQPSFQLGAEMAVGVVGAPTTKKYPGLQQQHLLFDDDFVSYQSQSQMMMMQHSNMLTDINAIFLNMSPIINLGVGNLDCSFSDAIPSPLTASLGEDLYLDPCSPLDSGGAWNNCLDLDLDSSDPLDDVFAVSKDDAGSLGCSGGDGPTLAALNSNSAILDDFDLDDLNPLPDENDGPRDIRGSCLNTPTHDGGAVDCLILTVVAPPAPDSSVAVVPSAAPDVIKTEPIEDAVPKSTLHELLVRSRSATISSSCPSQYETNGYYVGGCRKIKREEGSSSVTDAFYKRKTDDQREVPCLRASTLRSNGRRSLSNACDSVSSMDSEEFGLILKSEINDADSHDEGFDSELDDSDHYDFSDADSEISWDGGGGCRERSLQNSRKKERFFWQYNLQAKGPKGTRLPLATETLDPHLLDEITDPVFSPSCQVKGIKHTGKARRGDGNDLNPNPKKLFQIGQELKKLNKVINDLTPVSELPFNVRPKSRKEKNKLASRACRLKKKAQHEANKLKLYGLDHEHRRLIHVLNEVRKSVVQRTNGETDQVSVKLSEHVDRLGKTFLKTKVAGHTAEFVNRVLDKVAAGNPTGGIDLV